MATRIRPLNENQIVEKEQYFRLIAFKEKYAGKAVFCRNDEEAEKFLILADEAGYKWGASQDLLDFKGWKDPNAESGIYFILYIDNMDVYYSRSHSFQRTKHVFIAHKEIVEFEVAE